MKRTSLFIEIHIYERLHSFTEFVMNENFHSFVHLDSQPCVHPSVESGFVDEPAAARMGEAGRQELQSKQSDHQDCGAEVGVNAKATVKEVWFNSPLVRRPGHCASRHSTR